MYHILIENSKNNLSNTEISLSISFPHQSPKRRVSNQGYCTCRRIIGNFNSYKKKLKRYQMTKNYKIKKSIALIVFQEAADIKGRPNERKTFMRNPHLVELAFQAFKNKIEQMDNIFGYGFKIIKESCSQLCGIPISNKSITFKPKVYSQKSQREMKKKFKNLEKQGINMRFAKRARKMRKLKKNLEKLGMNTVKKVQKMKRHVLRYYQIYKKVHSKCCTNGNPCCSKTVYHSSGKSFISIFREYSRRTRDLLRRIEHQGENRRLHKRTRNLLRRLYVKLLRIIRSL